MSIAIVAVFLTVTTLAISMAFMLVIYSCRTVSLSILKALAVTDVNYERKNVCGIERRWFEAAMKMAGISTLTPS